MSKIQSYKLHQQLSELTKTIQGEFFVNNKSKRIVSLSGGKIKMRFEIKGSKTKITHLDSETKELKVFLFDGDKDQTRFKDGESYREINNEDMTLFISRIMEARAKLKMDEDRRKKAEENEAEARRKAKDHAEKSRRKAEERYEKAKSEAEKARRIADDFKQKYATSQSKTPKEPPLNSESSPQDFQQRFAAVVDKLKSAKTFDRILKESTKMFSTIDLLELLGNIDYSEPAIKKCYKQLALKYHPDRLNESELLLIGAENASELFKLIEAVKQELLSRIENNQLGPRYSTFIPFPREVGKTAENSSAGFATSSSHSQTPSRQSTPSQPTRYNTTPQYSSQYRPMTAEEMMRAAEAKLKAEEEAKRKAKDIKKAEEEAKRKAEDIKKAEEEAKRKAEKNKAKSQFPAGKYVFVPVEKKEQQVPQAIPIAKPAPIPINQNEPRADTKKQSKSSFNVDDEDSESEKISSDLTAIFLGGVFEKFNSSRDATNPSASKVVEEITSIITRLNALNHNSITKEHKESLKGISSSLLNMAKKLDATPTPEAKSVFLKKLKHNSEENTIYTLLNRLCGVHTGTGSMSSVRKKSSDQKSELDLFVKSLPKVEKELFVGKYAVPMAVPIPPEKMFKTHVNNALQTQSNKKFSKNILCLIEYGLKSGLKENIKVYSHKTASLINFSKEEEGLFKGITFKATVENVGLFSKKEEEQREFGIFLNKKNNKMVFCILDTESNKWQNLEVTPLFAADQYKIMDSIVRKNPHLLMQTKSSNIRTSSDSKVMQEKTPSTGPQPSNSVQQVKPGNHNQIRQ